MENNRKYRLVDLNKLIDVNNNKSMYFAGLIASDGSIVDTGSTDRFSIDLQVSDAPILYAMREHYGSNNPIVERSQYNKKRKQAFHTVCFRINQRGLAKALATLGIIQNKSLIMEFPKIPANTLPDYLRGILDGDGTITFHNMKKRTCPRVDFNSGSEKFTVGTLEAILSLGFRAKIYKDYRPKTNKTYYKVRLATEDAPNFLQFLYKKDEPSLMRKTLLANEIIQSAGLVINIM